MRTLRIALAQHDFLVGDIDGNLAKIIVAIHAARDRHKADVVLFPELALTGYPPEDLLLSRRFLRHATEALNTLASGVHGIHVVLGHPQQNEHGLFNAASVLAEGQVVGSYHKQILPNYGVFDERRYFTPGSEALVVDIHGVSTGITVCEDIWFPAPAQQSVQGGARLILNLNASPFHLGKMHEREQTVQQRVRETGVPIVYVNLVGGQDELVFDGASFALDHTAQVVFRAQAFAEELAVVELTIHENGGVFIAPQKIVAHPSIEQAAYQALVLGVRDYVRKSGFTGVLLGLSGGIDSALTLCVAVDALGAQNVLAVMLPSRYTASISLHDAEQLANNLGVDYRVINIEDCFTSFLDALAPSFAGLASDATEENIQARCRGTLLMALSNKTGKMVLTTGNKSEMAVGYSTLYGDMAGGFDVLKDVPKILVYRLAHYCNRQREIIPARIITRAPTAELRENQTDQDSLPPYEILDAIIECYIEKTMHYSEIVAQGHDAATVERVIRMIDLNEYKRRQAPPGIRITPKAFGKDRRMPIVNGYRVGKYKQS